MLVQDQAIEQIRELREKYDRFKAEVHKVIIGQDDIIEQLFISILAKGHCLLVGVPGLAKTLLVSTFANVLDLKFNRIQFTPDLMPSDITGTEILEEDMTTQHKSFKFIQGPVFANVILADEINRTPPKTQSALLEAMQEHQVTSAGKKYRLDEPFFVLATQNPIEQEGTYPLPEAQLDRFMFNLMIDYPTPDQEKQIVKSTTSSEKRTLEKVLHAKELIQFQDLVRQAPVADNVIDYAVTCVGNTRPKTSRLEDVKQYISWGAGPRASQYLILAAKVRCLLHGRFTPEIEDIKQVALPVLRHRLILNFSAEAEGIKPDQLVERLLKA